MKIENTKAITQPAVKTRLQKSDKTPFHQSLVKASQDWEAFQLKSMIHELKMNGSDEDGLFGQSLAQDFYRDMFDDVFAKEMAKAGGIGLTDFMLKNFKTTHEIPKEEKAEISSQAKNS